MTLATSCRAAHYSLALDTAREAADDKLIATAHGHAAQLAANEGLNTAALDHITAASEHARSTPTIASWLASTEATIHADQGDHTAARDALDRAHTALDKPAGHPVPASFHSCATAYLTAATGHVLLQAGDHNDARVTLTAALNQSHQAPRRQRVLILVDLAAVELSSGNLPDACSHATQAVDLLHQVAYAVGAARLRAFRTAAQRPLPNGALRALDEHLSQIAA